MKTAQGHLNVYKYAPTKTIHANDVTFAYRDLGPQGGVPVVLSNHWGASAAGRAQDHGQGGAAALGRSLSHRDGWPSGTGELAPIGLIELLASSLRSLP